MSFFQSDEEFIKEWEEIREGGMLQFMLTHGLAFGLLMLVVMSAFEVYETSFKEVFLSWSILKLVLVNFIFGIFGYGPCMWILRNRIYRKKRET